MRDTLRVKNPSHLPIQHPDYRYPGSLNPYWTKLKQTQGWVYSDNETETRRGLWKSGHSTPSQLHVEIGCNAGHVIVELAHREPGNHFIGIDWKFKAIHRAFEKAQKRGIQNLSLLRAHAERIPFMFADGEIDHLYLFFPDPWAKKSQWKNRFINRESLKLIAQLVRVGGIFEIKTDHPGYFEWMEESVAANSELWKVRSRSTDLHLGHPNPTTLTFPEVTCFERLFIKDGLPIHRLELERLG